MWQPVQRMISALIVLRRYVIGVAVAFVAVILYFVVSGVYYTWNTCIAEPRGAMSNLAGYDFELSETNCDTLAKDDAINVYASKHGDTKKTLVFKYVPESGGLPAITATGPDSIEISIVEVGYIFQQERRIGDLSISYHINVVHFPSDRDITNQ